MSVSIMQNMLLNAVCSLSTIYSSILCQRYYERKILCAARDPQDLKQSSTYSNHLFKEYLSSPFTTIIVSHVV